MRDGYVKLRAVRACHRFLYDDPNVYYWSWSCPRCGRLNGHTKTRWEMCIYEQPALSPACAACRICGVLRRTLGGWVLRLRGTTW